MRAAQLLHFTQAAESLLISQPTLSTHIQQLEEELGLPMFDRIGRSVRLTEAGKIFLEHSLHALRNLDRAREEIADLSGEVEGNLRLGALFVFGNGMLPAWIPSFREKYPNVRIEVHSGTSDFIDRELEAGDIDLGLSFTPSSNISVEGLALASAPVALVVSERHAFADREQIEIPELASIPLALVSHKLAARARLEPIVAAHKIRLNVLIESDDVQVLLKIVSSDHLLGTLLSRFAATNYPNVRSIPIVGAPHINLGVLWKKDSHLSPAARVFLEHVKTECGIETLAASGDHS